MLDPTFKGANIFKNGGNNKPAQLNDPKIDAAMDKAAALPGDAPHKAGAEIDKMITGDAPAVPFDWDKTTIIWSKDVQGVVNTYYTDLDFTFTSLKYATALRRSRAPAGGRPGGAAPPPRGRRPWARTSFADCSTWSWCCCSSPRSRS